MRFHLFHPFEGLTSCGVYQIPGLLAFDSLSLLVFCEKYAHDMLLFNVDDVTWLRGALAASWCRSSAHDGDDEPVASVR